MEPSILKDVACTLKMIRVVLFLAFLLFLDFSCAEEYHDLSLIEEKRLGESIMQELRASHLLLEDPIVTTYLNDFGQKLVTHLPVHDYTYHFLAIDDRSINAFAFFGGYIGIHTGLILLTRTESELAAVIAHEMAHIQQHHLARMLQQNKKLLPFTLVELFAALAIGTVAPEASSHLVHAVLAGHQQQLINYTRAHEEEADRIGVGILAKAGFDPNAMVDFFHQMENHHCHITKPPQYLLTHPIYETRIADAMNRARHYSFTARSDDLSYGLIQARLTVRTLGPLDALEFFAERAQRKAISHQYGYALSLLAINQLQKAALTLHHALEQAPDNWILHLTAIEILVRQQEYSLALTKIKSLRQKYPHILPLVLKHAQILLMTDSPFQAEQILEQHRSIQKDSLDLYDLLARTKERLGKKAEVHSMKAEWHLLRGEIKQALAQIAIGLEKVKSQRLRHILTERRQQILARQRL